MDIGLLIFDDDKKTDLHAKVDTAVESYAQKFGQLPSHCYVHPSQLSKGIKSNGIRIGAVQVKPLQTVLLHHFWLGTDSEPA